MDQNKTPLDRIQKRFHRKSNRSYYTPSGKENWDPDFADYTKGNESPTSSIASPASSSGEREMNESTPRMESNGRNRGTSKHNIRKTYKDTRKTAGRGEAELSPLISIFSVWEDESFQ
jgi:hypothetical protein